MFVIFSFRFKIVMILQMMEFFDHKKILLSYLTFVSFHLFPNLIIAEETSHSIFNSSLLIQTYKPKICELKDTCNIIDQIPQSLQDLRKRNCMCDRLCPSHQDCCRDSNRTEIDIDVKFVCKNTRFDGGVYMIQSCADKWNEKSIKEKCLASNSTQLSHDILLQLPVTSIFFEIFYANVFCAICNEEWYYEFWNIAFIYELSGSKNNHSLIGAGDILANLSFNRTGEMIWSSYVNESLYKCYLEPIVPLGIKSLRYCVPDVIRSCKNGEICDGFSSYVYSGDRVYKNLECAKCNDETNESKGCPEPEDDKFKKNVVQIFITDTLLPIVPHCDDFPVNTLAYRLLCKKKDTSEQIKDCSRINKKSKALICYISKYYYRSHNDYYYVNNKTVFIYEYDMEFPENEWAAWDDDRIFVCGRQIPITRYQRIMSSINNITSEVLIKISIFCIVVHLLKFWQQPDLRKLSDKNLASLCVALLTAFISLEIGPWLPSCEIVAIVTHYSILSCFSWMLVISYDICIGMYRATVKLHLPGKKRQSKFLIYSLVAWMLPVVVAIGPAMYAEFTPSNVVSCDLKPGYGEGDECFIARPKPHIYFFMYPAFVIFIVNICFFSYAAYLIYSSRRKSVNPMKHHNFKVYLRLGLLTGLTWTVGLLVTLTDSELIGLLFVVFNMSQGIFIFFLFTFDRKMFKALHCQEKTNVSRPAQMDSL